MLTKPLPSHLRIPVTPEASLNAMRTSLYELALEHNTSQQNETLKQQVMQNLLDFEESINGYQEILKYIRHKRPLRKGRD